MFKRRQFIMCAVSGTAFTLAGCKTVVGGNGTKVSIDVERLIKYSEAILNAANIAAGTFSVYYGLKGYVDLIQTVSHRVGIMVDSLKSAVGNNLTINYNDENYKTIIDSIISGGVQILDIFQRILTDLPSGIVTDSVMKTFNTVYVALSTIVNLFKLMVDLIPDTASTTGRSMSEYEALEILNNRHEVG